MEKRMKILEDLESNLTTALISGNGALFQFNVNEQKLFLSDSYYCSLGYNSFERDHNSELVDHIHPGDRMRIETLLKTFSNNGNNIIKTEFRVKSKSGETRWVSCHGRATDGTPLRILGLIVDITNQKKIENACSESERKLSTLMNNLPGMAYRCKPDNQLSMEFASQGSYKLLGCHPSDLVGKTDNAYRKLVDPSDREYLIKCVSAALNEKRFFSLIYKVRKKTGEMIWVWEQGEGVFSAKGKLLALEGFITDITQQKKAELDLRKENIKLKNLTNDRYKFGEIVGKSPEMQKVYDLIIKAASSDVNVIIYGESGTGKELVARSIYELSDRKDHPFVTVNCGAINENIMESEFFGHKKGAFTGATTDRIGYLEKSNSGTLFLDEIGEMSKNIQVLLLRAIELKEFTPMGGGKTKASDFRIIAATHRNLAERIKTKKMREDFYYRINVFAIHLPPLRNRKEDIPLLIDHFIETYPGKAKISRIPPAVMEAFQHYDWPGNVREFQNAIHRYIAIGKIDFLEEQYNSNQNEYNGFNEFYDINAASISGLRNTISMLEKNVIRHALEKHQWNREKTSIFLKIDRKTLYRKIKEHNLAYNN